jgi:hypothetical protein
MLEIFFGKEAIFVQFSHRAFLQWAGTSPHQSAEWFVCPSKST